MSVGVEDRARLFREQCLKEISEAFGSLEFFMECLSRTQFFKNWVKENIQTKELEEMKELVEQLNPIVNEQKVEQHMAQFGTLETLNQSLRQNLVTINPTTNRPRKLGILKKFKVKLPKLLRVWGLVLEKASIDLPVLQ